MATVKHWPTFQSLIRTRGTLQYTIDRGVIVVKKWPRRRPGTPTPAQQAARDLFAKMVYTVNNTDPNNWKAARALAEGTGFTARDILSSAVCGTLIQVVVAMETQISLELDLISDIEGAILYRGSDAWYGLLPGVSGQVLKTGGPAAVPAWGDLPAAATGLYGPVFGTIPTSANTGLTTWLNQGATGLVTDAQTGIVISDATSNGTGSLRCRTKAVPTTPYSATVLICLQGNPTNFISAGIGFYNGANKLETMSLVYSTGWILAAQKWNSTTSFSANDANTSAGIFQPIWLQVRDDGTSVHFAWSYDGSTFTDLYNTTKNTGWLGTAGYNHLAIFTNSQGAATHATFMQYND